MTLRLIGIVLGATIGFSQPLDAPLQMWRNIRGALTSADGDEYFQKNMKDCQLPLLNGNVVSQPSPNELIVNVDDPAGDAKLRFLLTLKSVAAGTAIRFEGVARSYTRSPFSITFNVEDDKIYGLPPEARR